MLNTLSLVIATVSTAVIVIGLSIMAIVAIFYFIEWFETKKRQREFLSQFREGGKDA